MLRKIGGRLADAFFSNIGMIGVILVIVSLLTIMNIGYKSSNIDTSAQLWAPTVDMVYEVRVGSPTVDAHHDAHTEDNYLFSATLIAKEEEIEWVRPMDSAVQKWWGEHAWGVGSGHLAMEKVYTTSAYELDKLDFQILSVEMIDQEGSRAKLKYPEQLIPTTLSIHGWKHAKMPTTPMIERWEPAQISILGAEKVDRRRLSGISNTFWAGYNWLFAPQVKPRPNVPRARPTRIKNAVEPPPGWGGGWDFKPEISSAEEYPPRQETASEAITGSTVRAAFAQNVIYETVQEGALDDERKYIVVSPGRQGIKDGLYILCDDRIVRRADGVSGIGDGVGTWSHEWTTVRTEAVAGSNILAHFLKGHGYEGMEFGLEGKFQNRETYFMKVMEIPGETENGHARKYVAAGDTWFIVADDGSLRAKPKKEIYEHQTHYLSEVGYQHPQNVADEPIGFWEGAITQEMSCSESPCRPFEGDFVQFNFPLVITVEFNDLDLCVKRRPNPRWTSMLEGKMFRYLVWRKSSIPGAYFEQWDYEPSYTAMDQGVSVLNPRFYILNDGKFYKDWNADGTVKEDDVCGTWTSYATPLHRLQA